MGSPDWKSAALAYGATDEGWSRLQRDAAVAREQGRPAEADGLDSIRCEINSDKVAREERAARLRAELSTALSAPAVQPDRPSREDVRAAEQMLAALRSTDFDEIIDNDLDDADRLAIKVALACGDQERAELLALAAANEWASWSDEESQGRINDMHRATLARLANEAREQGFDDDEVMAFVDANPNAVVRRIDSALQDDHNAECLQIVRISPRHWATYERVDGGIVAVHDTEEAALASARETVEYWLEGIEEVATCQAEARARYSDDGNESISDYDRSVIDGLRAFVAEVS